VGDFEKLHAGCLNSISGLSSHKSAPEPQVNWTIGSRSTLTQKPVQMSYSAVGIPTPGLKDGDDVIGLDLFRTSWEGFKLPPLPKVKEDYQSFSLYCASSLSIIKGFFTFISNLSPKAETAWTNE